LGTEALWVEPLADQGGGVGFPAGLFGLSPRCQSAGETETGGGVVRALREGHAKQGDRLLQIRRIALVILLESSLETPPVGSAKGLGPVLKRLAGGFDFAGVQQSLDLGDSGQQAGGFSPDQ
jgi:hypothetical protein